jgi:VWFA-related protein
MRSVKKLLTACVTWGLMAALAAPALPQEPVAQGPAIRTQVNLVNLFATVRDKNKRIVPDLKQQDFKILEDGQDQQIAFFSREVTLPITLALLLDTSGSEQYMLGAIQDMGGRFLDRVLRKGDESLVMSFDVDVDLLSDWTDDRGQLDRAIRKARINAPTSGGMINPGPVPTRGAIGTAFYDAIYLACNEKLTSEAGRKAIVVVTDADDNGSKVKLEEAVEAAQRTDTVVHILLVADPHFGGGNTGVARKITEETGGRMIVANSEKHLAEAFDQISEELRSQYTLGYYPTNTTHDGKFRKIKVDMANHDLKVLAR